MINKNTLQSFISKYYINGLNNQVKWRIKDNTLTVYAGESGRVCKVVLSEFNFEDCEIGVFDTNKLIKLLSITNGDLLLSSEKQGELHTKLNISDANFELSYALADTLIMGKSPWYNDPEEGFEIELSLVREEVDNLIKAKNALNDVDNMLVQSSKDLDGNIVCEFLFGDNTGFSNKIEYQLQGTITDESIKLPFNSDIFKDILNANKDIDTCSIKISKKGMMKLSFEGGINSIYYIARNE
tara:strand:- start:1253 stop:1975 length:723 start_codon:yes stop_codon:yes gene_type:complete